MKINKEASSATVFADMGMSKAELPVNLGRDVWRKIIGYLSFSQIVRSRLWSKKFREITLNPTENLLQTSVLDLDYDIPLEKLTFNELYFHSDQPCSEQERKTFIQSIRALHAAYSDGDQAYNRIFKTFNSIYQLTKTDKANTLEKCHPLLAHVVTHYIYLITSNFFLMTWWLNMALNFLVCP